MAQPTIALYTDFGPDNLYVGQLHACIMAEAPGIGIIDLHHNAPAFAPGLAGLLLFHLIPYLPPGCVVVGVIDPGVGTQRGTLAVPFGGHWFVGPDNGLFGPVILNGEAECFRLKGSMEKEISASFHGRDLFAPAGAALCRGDRMVLGEPVSEPVILDVNPAQIVYQDRYGNLMTGLVSPPLPPEGQPPVLCIQGRRLPFARTFGEVSLKELFWYRNSLGLVEIAAREASAGQLLGVGLGTQVRWEDSPL